MSLRSRPSRTGFLVALAVLGAVAGGAGVATAPAALADAGHPVATDEHDTMLPAGSPDAQTSGGTRGPVARATVPQGGAAAAAPLSGVDVSRYQHPSSTQGIDWGQVAGSGQTFAIVKATEYATDANGQPTLVTNPYLQQDVTGARAAGLAVTEYAFARPRYPAAVQADQLADAIASFHDATDLPPVLDLEDNGGLAPAALATWTQSFLDRLQARTGVVPIIYSSPNFWTTSMADSRAFVRYPLWVANYSDTATAPKLFGGWATWDLWQYSQSGSVPGISGAVDLDRFNGTSTASLVHRVPASVTAPASLGTRDSVVSPSGQYRLDVQADGNVVEYGNGRALWWTGTFDQSGAHLDLQADGNLVVYSGSGAALWNSRTYGSGSGNRLVVQDDGDVALLSASGAVLWHDGAPGSDGLASGGSLVAGQSLHSPSGQYRLDVQADGNLVEYGNGRALWYTSTWSGKGTHLDLQADGNLVLYSAAGAALWNSGTYGSGSGNRLAVQDDGNLVVYASTGRALWTNGAPGSDRLSAGAGLTAGQSLHSPSWAFQVTVQADGNVVVYRGGSARWSTGTYGHPGARLALQSDGNLVVYDTRGVALWNSGTYGSGNADQLAMQDDGNLVLYAGSRAVWATYSY